MNTTEMVLTVFVKTPHGEVMEIHLCDTEEQLKSITVLQLLEKIEENNRSYEPEGLRLIFTGQLLTPSAKLSEYGIQNKSTFYMIQRILGGGNKEGMGDKEGKNRSMEELAKF
ncbi:ubiquitin-40S ribosomal protein S27b [Etheostoma spectabile]|uniref:ubiquitin-40S ribosomal protein S27b n=1 Tax=Etheostoma spectabile TaxID=54343 RepID=UPI0013AF2E1F|nr:ubiquitin-40S ribosomal protein S27b-like [Etheostoma spectabile]